jgi:hypothetical protein
MQGRPDFAALNRMTTTELDPLVTQNRENSDLLCEIKRVLALRNGEKSIALAKRVDEFLNSLAPLKSQRPWYSRPATYVVGALGALAVGLGHGAGAEIWKHMWPTVQKLLF